MMKIILSVAAALALTACGEVKVGDQSLQNVVGAAIDEEGFVGAVNQSIDREAVEGIARGAVAGAVQEAIPPELRAVGAVVDERALAKGLDQAVDGEALGNAVAGAIDGIKKGPAE